MMQLKQHLRSAQPKLKSLSLNKIYGAIALALKPSANDPIIAWVESNVILVDGKSTYYDSSITPWARKPLKLFTDSNTREINLLWSPGLGKTAMIEAATCYIVANQAGPYLFVGAKENEIQLWFDHRLKGSLKQCEAIKPLYPTDRRNDKVNTLKFPHMPIWTASAESLADLQGKSVRYLLLDELWTFPQGSLAESVARTHSRGNRKVICISQASDLKSDWHEQCQKGKQLEWQYQCDNCENYSPYNIDDFDYQIPDGDTIDYKLVRDTTFLVCPKCGHAHKDDAATRRRLANNAKYVDISNDAYDDEVATLIVNQFAKYSDRWADTILKYIKAENQRKAGYHQPIKKVKQKQFVEWWSESESQEVIPPKLGDYYMSQSTPLVEGAIRLAAIDVQKNHFWMGIRDYYPDGSSRLIDYRKVLTFPDILEQVRQYQIKPSRVYFDIAYNTESICNQLAIYGFVGVDGKTYTRSYTHKHKGKTFELPYSPWKTRATTNGKTCYYLNYNGKDLKDIVYNMRIDESIRFEVGQDIENYPDWLNQIDGEQKKLRTDSKGRQIYDWIRTRKDNHAVDIENTLLLGALLWKIPILQSTKTSVKA
jgi:phage terminase large subunit GpA-like protein